jgi:hypothetical protein
MALGEGLAGAAADERGAELLSAIAEAVERRDLVLERWVRTVARRQQLQAARGSCLPGRRALNDRAPAGPILGR